MLSAWGSPPPSPLCSAALFEPDVVRQAPPVPSPHPLPPPPSAAAFLQSLVSQLRSSSRGATLIRRLFFSHPTSFRHLCLPPPPPPSYPPPPPPSPSRDTSIGSFTSLQLYLPIPLFSSSLLVWPTAPFCFAQGGKRVSCVCCRVCCRVCVCVLPGSVPALISLLVHYYFILSSPLLDPLLPPYLPSTLCSCHSLHLLLITPPPSFSLAISIHISLSLSPLLPPPLLGSGAVNRCCLLLIWVRSD